MEGREPTTEHRNGIGMGMDMSIGMAMNMDMYSSGSRISVGVETGKNFIFLSNFGQKCHFLLRFLVFQGHAPCSLLDPPMDMGERS